MATFLKRGERVQVVRFAHSFEWRDEPGSGFSFDCDENGVVDVAALAEPGRENYARCLAGLDGQIIDEGIRRYEWSYWEPSVIRCDRCRRELALVDVMTNECDCGALYNGGGQRLAPVEQWGEETGEHYADILSGYDPDPSPPDTWGDLPLCEGCQEPICRGGCPND